MPAMNSDNKKDRIDIKPMRPLNFKKDFENRLIISRDNYWINKERKKERRKDN